MTLTLHRGAQLIGELHVQSWQRSRDPSDDHVEISAYLILADDAPQLSGLWQLECASPRGLVIQDPLDPIFIDHHSGGRPRRAPHSGHQALEPLSVEEVARGVPADRQFTVHDAPDRAHLPRELQLLEFHVADAYVPAALPDAPAGARVNGVVWHVHITLDAEAELASRAPTP